MKTEVISVIIKEEEIRKITDKLKAYRFNEIKKHPHFEFSIMEKLTNIKELEETFSKF